MSDFKVLLVSLYNDEAYGLRQLQAIIRQKGYAVRALFMKVNRKKSGSAQGLNVVTNREMGLFGDFVKEYEPDLVGFSLVSSNFTLYRRIYSQIRGLGKFKVLVGGWQASLNPEKTIEFCDMLCIGEGEGSIGEVADRLSSGRSAEGIRNLWVKMNGRVVKNPLNPLITDFDQIPNVYFDNTESYYIENDELINQDPYADNTRYGTMLARGCPFACTYCSNSYMAHQVYQKEWSRIRRRSVNHVLDELREVKRSLPKVERINFYDEVFLPGGEYGRILLDRYKREIGLPFYCMFYPGTCNEETCKFLKDAGLKGVWIGVQSGSERVRREVFKRNYTNDGIKRQSDIFHKYGISIRYDFIFNNPFEDAGETEESIKLMQELPTPFSVNLFSLKFFPNTDITQMALKAGIISQSQLDDQLMDDHHVYLVDDKKKEEIRRRVGVGEIVFT